LIGQEIAKAHDAACRPTFSFDQDAIWFTRSTDDTAEMKAADGTIFRTI